MNVTLAKALKVKNQLAGEIKELEVLISNINSYKEGSASRFDSNALMADLQDKMLKLIAVKIAIQTANVRILPALTNLAETKAYAGWLKSINTTEGLQSEGGGYGTPLKDVLYKVNFDATWVRDKVKEAENQISDLQDQIDTYNATFTVDLP